MKHSFVRVAVGVPKAKVADCAVNTQAILELIDRAAVAQADVLCLPELCVTGYSCGDLFLHTPLLEAAERSLGRIVAHSRGKDLFLAVGLPVRAGHRLYNAAAAICAGELLGVVPKTFLPNYGEFYERRWFSAAGPQDPATVWLCGGEVPFGTDLLFCCEQVETLKIGLEICEDLWAVIPPSSRLSLLGASVLLGLSASDELSGKSDYRRGLVVGQSARTFSVYAYANAGMGESTADMVYSGHSLICENGRLLRETEKYPTQSVLAYADADLELLAQERLRNKSFAHRPPEGRAREIGFSLPLRERGLERFVDPRPFVPAAGDSRAQRCREIFDIQVAGLAGRLSHIGCRTAVLGVSGGLDSTLALLVTARSFDLLGRERGDILGVTMPGFGTTDRTHQNALRLMDALGVSAREIPIRDACLQHFRDIGHDPGVHDVTYENVQARERTQILMDLANRHDGLVVGTGDLSEIALGWSTYNGDHMSMYAVNAGVPKTLIRSLVRWAAAAGEVEGAAAALLRDIADTPVSPELLPPGADGAIRQRTEDILGPYELHDFFLYWSVRYGFSPRKIAFLCEHAFAGAYDRAVILKWMDVFYRRFFSQQFKRSCMPDGPKVGSVALSPRGDWRMPSDACAAEWLREVEQLERE